MSTTIRDVLLLKEWKSCRLIAGEKGIDREVQYIDSMEVPDIIPWLKKNELLITTAYAIKESEETLLKIIHALAEQKSAGIALKTKFLGAITKNVIETADMLQVPVIEIPSDMPVIDLANPLMKRIVNDQNRSLEFTKNISEKFLAVQIEGGSFDEISQILGVLLQCKILVTDSRQKLVCCFPQNIQTQGEWVLRGEYDELLVCDQLREFASVSKKGISVIQTGAEEIWTHAIYVKAKCYGYLHVIGKRGQFNQLSEIAMRQTAVHLALEFSKQGVKEQKEYYQDNNFFLDLIGNNIQSEDEAEKRAKGLRWSGGPYYIAVSDIDGFEEITREKEEDEIQRIKDDIIQIHKDTILKKSFPFFIGNKSDSFHCLFPKQTGRQEIKRIMEKIQEQVCNALGITISTGISRETARYLDFEKAYSETRTAITICKKKKMKICFADEVQLEEAFFEMAKMKHFQNIVRDSLSVLKEYDRNRGSYLMETLRVLVENQGARKETAEILYLHRNTLAYRIRQIEQLTKLDLRDPQVLFQLQLALRIEVYMESW